MNSWRRDGLTGRTSRLRASQVASAAFVLIGLPACVGRSDAADSSLVEPEEVRWERTIVRPGIDHSTLWLGRPTKLWHDPATGHLLALERDDQQIVEFTTDGRLLGTFGRRGQGPGELRNLFAFGVATSHLTALDIGNGKLVVFDRATREMTTEIRLDRAAKDVTAIGDTLLAVLPGPDGTLFELLRPDGRRVGSFGDGGFAEGHCVGCSITYVGRGLLVVIKPDVPEGRVYRLDGTMFDAFAFTELAHVLAEWREDFLETIRRASGIVAAGGGGRIAAGKLWVGKPVPVGEGSSLVLASPENLDRNPAELWELDQRGRVAKRYIFDRVQTFRPAASLASLPNIYTVRRDGGFEIDEHLMPGVAGNR